MREDLPHGDVTTIGESIDVHYNNSRYGNGGFTTMGLSSIVYLLIRVSQWGCGSESRARNSQRNVETISYCIDFSKK